MAHEQRSDEAKQHSVSKPITPVWTITPPLMSWDRPIEEIILEHVRSMRRNWQVQQTENIWGNVRKDAKSIIMAYESVEDYILREMKLRADIAASRQERASDLRSLDSEGETKA